MTLYDLMYPAMSGQIFHVYVTNNYDQNIEVGHGTRRVIMDEEETDGIDHLMDAVDTWHIAKDESMVIRLLDGHFNELAEAQFDPRYVAEWDYSKPETRPWKRYCELEGFGEN